MYSLARALLPGEGLPAEAIPRSTEPLVADQNCQSCWSLRLCPYTHSVLRGHFVFHRCVLNLLFDLRLLGDR